MWRSNQRPHCLGGAQQHVVGVAAIRVWGCNGVLSTAVLLIFWDDNWKMIEAKEAIKRDNFAKKSLGFQKISKFFMNTGV